MLFCVQAVCQVLCLSCVVSILLCMHCIIAADFLYNPFVSNTMLKSWSLLVTTACYTCSSHPHFLSHVQLWSAAVQSYLNAQTCVPCFHPKLPKYRLQQTHSTLFCMLNEHSQPLPHSLLPVLATCYCHLEHTALRSARCAQHRRSNPSGSRSGLHRSSQSPVAVQSVTADAHQTSTNSTRSACSGDADPGTDPQPNTHVTTCTVGITKPSLVFMLGPPVLCCLLAQVLLGCGWQQ